jgi:hypothetical protein
VLNHTFWRRHFTRRFIPHLRRLLETLEHRILPTFDNVEEEATRIQEETYHELMNMPAGPDDDPSVPAELAHEAGLAHYEDISDVKQTLLNIYASLLYHSWEQQLLEFHRREALHPNEQHDHALLHLAQVQRRLLENGIDITMLPSWPVLHELRLVANAVKHAEGVSAEKLKQVRPDLFELPSTAGYALPSSSYVPRVYAPLSGSDLYVQLGDLRNYVEAAVSFWQEFPDALAAA